MQKQHFLIKIILVLTASYILLFTGTADSEETTLQYELDTKYSGAQPAGSAPWLKAIFDNNEVNDKDPKKILLTMSVSNLAKNEGVRMWFFNAALNISEMKFSHVSGPKAIEIDITGNYLAGGGGYFDIRFKFSIGEFNGGKTSVYEISYFSDIEATALYTV